jgi:hypothetical protein
MPSLGGMLPACWDHRALHRIVWSAEIRIIDVHFLPGAVADSWSRQSQITCTSTEAFRDLDVFSQITETAKVLKPHDPISHI